MDNITITKEDLLSLVGSNVTYGRIINPSVRVIEMCEKLGMHIGSVENGFGGYTYIDLDYENGNC